MLKMKYLAFMITAMAVSALLLSSSAHAQVPAATVNIYAWTDKPYYNPGDKGVLKIVIRNDRTDTDLILQNITIEYPWFGYMGDRWEGNTTITPSSIVLSKNGGTYSTTTEFTVPTDGRAATLSTGSTIDIRVAVDKQPYYYPVFGPYTVTLYVRSVPTYTLPEGMDKIVTLFTIQTVLIIVCTIIIAATIFLSARRPQAMLKAEEKTG